jgi:uncharacterized Zn-finger protein
VSTALVSVVQGGVQNNWMYSCNVEGCFKCFSRGEHLKRHVRSTHTNEKRELFLRSFVLSWGLTFGDSIAAHRRPVEGRGKNFSRHDDLGQHMHVHKGQVMAVVVEA